MVIVTNWPPSIAASQWLAEVVGPGEKLSPPTRAAVLMALLGIVLVGLLLAVVILLGGHWVRRQGSHRRGPSVPSDRRPLSPPTASDASDALPPDPPPSSPDAVPP